jgi:hypothetical protein
MGESTNENETLIGCSLLDDHASCQIVNTTLLLVHWLDTRVDPVYVLPKLRQKMFIYESCPSGGDREVRC